MPIPKIADRVIHLRPYVLMIEHFVPCLSCIVLSAYGPQDGRSDGMHLGASGIIDPQVYNRHCPGQLPGFKIRPIMQIAIVQCLYLIVSSPAQGESIGACTYRRLWIVGRNGLEKRRKEGLWANFSGPDVGLGRLLSEEGEPTRKSEKIGKTHCFMRLLFPIPHLQDVPSFSKHLHLDTI